MSSGSGTTSSQSALPAATTSSLTTALGCSGAVTQMLPLRMTPAASAAERSSEALMPSGPMEVTAQTGILGRGLGKSRIGQFHHGQRAACLAKAAGSGSQLGGRTGQGLPGAQGLGGLRKQLRCHRLPVHPNAGRERLTACVVAAGNEAEQP